MDLYICIMVPNLMAINNVSYMYMLMYFMCKIRILYVHSLTTVGVSIDVCPHLSPCASKDISLTNS